MQFGDGQRFFSAANRFASASKSSSAGSGVDFGDFVDASGGLGLLSLISGGSDWFASLLDGLVVDPTVVFFSASGWSVRAGTFSASGTDSCVENMWSGAD